MCEGDGVRCRRVTSDGVGDVSFGTFESEARCAEG